jgi:hypothetical protein
MSAVAEPNSFKLASRIHKVLRLTGCRSLCGVRGTRSGCRRDAVKRQIRQLLETHALQGWMGQGIVAAIVHVLKPEMNVEELLCEGQEV